MKHGSITLAHFTLLWCIRACWWLQIFTPASHLIGGAWALTILRSKVQTFKVGPFVYVVGLRLCILLLRACAIDHLTVNIFLLDSLDLFGTFRSLLPLLSHSSILSLLFRRIAIENEEFAAFEIRNFAHRRVGVFISKEAQRWSLLELIRGFLQVSW